MPQRLDRRAVGHFPSHHLPPGRPRARAAHAAAARGGRPRGSRRAPAAVGRGRPAQPRRGPLHRQPLPRPWHRRRRPRAGRPSRPGQGRPRLQGRRGARVPRLRRAHHLRRGQAALPRPRLERPPAPAGAGAARGHGRRRAGADPEPRPDPDPGRGGGRPSGSSPRTSRRRWPPTAASAPCRWTPRAGSTPASTLGDLIVDDSDDFRDVERHELLRPVLEGLKERDRLILRLRFVGGCTQEEIGRELGVSQMQVSRLLSSIMARLRAGLADAEAS